MDAEVPFLRGLLYARLFRVEPPHTGPWDQNPVPLPKASFLDEMSPEC